MDYLLSQGRKVCSIKILQRPGRMPVGEHSLASFPKTVCFLSRERPMPQKSYEVKLRGIGTAAIDITSVYARQKEFLVEARVLSFAVHAEERPAASA